LTWKAVDEYSEKYKEWQAGPVAVLPVAQHAAPVPPVASVAVDHVPPVVAAGPPVLSGAIAVPPVQPGPSMQFDAIPVRASAPIVPPTAAITTADMERALAESPSSLPQILAAIAGRAQPRGSSWYSDATDGVTMSPRDMLVETSLNKLAAGKYVDPVSLDSTSLSWIMFKAPFATPGLEASSNGTMVVRANTRLPDTAGVFEAHRVFGGYLKLIELASNDLQQRFSAFYLGQMLKVLNLVQSISYATELSKGTLFKHFLLKTVGITNLVEAYNGSSMLFMELLVRQTSQPPMISLADPSARRGTKRAAPSVASQSRGGPAVMSASSSRDPKVRQVSVKPCKSRCDTGISCAYEDCIFSHACVSCGQNHPASACSAWVPAKGAAAMALISAPRRR
jgi:hypothetical protein